MPRCLVLGTRFCPDPKLIADEKVRRRVMDKHRGCPPRNWGNPKLEPIKGVKGRIYDLAAEVARLVCVNDAQYVDDPPSHHRLDLAANELGHLLGLPEPEFQSVWRTDDNNDAVTVGPDEVLIIALPRAAAPLYGPDEDTFVDPLVAELDQLGLRDRCLVIYADGVQFAKVKR